MCMFSAVQFIMVNKICPHASHGTGNISNASRHPLSIAYETLSLEVSQHSEHVLLNPLSLFANFFFFFFF